METRRTKLVDRLVYGYIAIGSLAGGLKSGSILAEGMRYGDLADVAKDMGYNGQSEIYHTLESSANARAITLFGLTMAVNIAVLSAQKAYHSGKRLKHQAKEIDDISDKVDDLVTIYNLAFASMDERGYAAEGSSELLHIQPEIVRLTEEAL